MEPPEDLVTNLLSTKPQEPDQALDRLAHQVIGAAIEGHRELGPGLLESVYEQALCLELSLRGISFLRQCEVAISYKGNLSDKAGWT